MSAQVEKHIAGRLSLRPPQAESLTRLRRMLEAVPEILSHEGRDLAAMLERLQAEFPSLEDSFLRSASRWPLV